ncbi:hypothetical protein C8R43DRAFT_443919 [Mycena crocata]|nr:hypothetical protein C8R43DRAFT_443919 [Mycena crocata]
MSELSNNLLLPLELQFLILEHIYAGTEGITGAFTELHRLTFICVAWAHHAQSLIFSHVVVNRANAERFLALLHGSPHLARHVTSLGVTNASDLDTTEIHDRLPNLSALTINAHIFESFNDAAHQWPAIISLYMKFSVISEPQDVGDFLGRFPALERLEFGGWMYAIDTTVPERTHAFHVRYLAFKSHRNHSPQPMAVCLARSNVTAERLFIQLFAADDRDASGYNELLERLGDSLQDLCVNGFWEEEGLPFVNSVRICPTPCTGLRELILGLDFNVGSPTNINIDLILFLQQLASPVLESICIQLPLSDDLIEKLPWREVDAILIGSRFCALRQLVFEVEGNRKPQLAFERFVNRLEERMDGMGSKGLLRFRRT